MNNRFNFYRLEHRFFGFPEHPFKAGPYVFSERYPVPEIGTALRKKEDQNNIWLGKTTIPPARYSMNRPGCLEDPGLRDAIKPLVVYLKDGRVGMSKLFFFGSSTLSGVESWFSLTADEKALLKENNFVYSRYYTDNIINGCKQSVSFASDNIRHVQHIEIV